VLDRRARGVGAAHALEANLGFHSRAQIAAWVVRLGADAALIPYDGPHESPTGAVRLNLWQ
jgi:hypothetical protein